MRTTAMRKAIMKIPERARVAKLPTYKIFSHTQLCFWLARKVWIGLGEERKIE